MHTHCPILYALHLKSTLAILTKVLLESAAVMKNKFVDFSSMEKKMKNKINGRMPEKIDQTKNISK